MKGSKRERERNTSRHEGKKKKDAAPLDAAANRRFSFLRNVTIMVWTNGRMDCTPRKYLKVWIAPHNIIELNYNLLRMHPAPPQSEPLLV